MKIAQITQMIHKIKKFNLKNKNKFKIKYNIFKNTIKLYDLNHKLNSNETLYMNFLIRNTNNQINN